ncbi:MAG: ribbon-helix-helix protein, CopG family [Chrysiogenales bacterium]
MTKSIRLPCNLKAKVKRLARLNGMTSSELVRYSIEAKLPDCEASRLPANNNDGHKGKQPSFEKITTNRKDRIGHGIQ